MAGKTAMQEVFFYKILRDSSVIAVPLRVNIHLPPCDIPDQAAHLHIALFVISTPNCSSKREKQGFIHFSFQSFQQFSRKRDQEAMPLEDTQTQYFPFPMISNNNMAEALACRRSKGQTRHLRLSSVDASSCTPTCMMSFTEDMGNLYCHYSL
jgi:hypothetical protein